VFCSLSLRDNRQKIFIAKGPVPAGDREGDLMETAPGIENSSTTPCPSPLRQTFSSPGLLVGMVLATVWTLFFCMKYLGSLKRPFKASMQEAEGRERSNLCDLKAWVMASEVAFYTNIVIGSGIIGWIIAMWYFSRKT
jgi:hypothetical protein